MNPQIVGGVPAEVIRKQYLKHEASIRSIGTMYHFGSAVLVCVAMIPAFDATKRTSSDFGVSLAILLIAAIHFVVGRLIKRLDPRAVLPVTILAAIELLAFGLGTAISAYILWLLHSRAGKYIFSPEYKQVIAATPQMKYRMSRIVVFLMWLTLAIFVFILIAVAINPHFGSTG